VSRFVFFFWLLILPDGGTGTDASVVAAKVEPKKPSAEDLEVISNLELLENLDESADLELMQELSVEQ
jgi:hypothetical protein